MKLGVLLADVKYRFADFENTSEYLLSRDISTVVVNSREASCGSLFIAIKGFLTVMNLWGKLWREVLPFAFAKGLLRVLTREKSF